MNTCRALSLLPMLLLAAGLAHPASAQADQAWPPGVRPIEPGDPERLLPPGIEVGLLEIDWAAPALRVEPLIGAGERWEDAAAARPGEILIQLVEPLRDDSGWQPALGEDSPARIGIGGIGRWLPVGGAITPDSPWRSPLPAQAWAAAPFLVQPGISIVEALDEGLLDGDFLHACIVSWTDFPAARTLLARVTVPGDGRGDLLELAPWIEARGEGRGWFALHATGPHAVAGRAGAWIGGEPPAGLLPRVGLALTLRAAGDGDATDLARGGRAVLRASSQVRDWEAARAASGRLLPSPLDPNGWLSRAERDALPWLEVEFPTDETVHEVRLVWAPAAGWSSHFVPGRAVLAGGAEAAELRELEVFERPREAVSVWRSETGMRLNRIRVTLEEPSTLALDRTARLCAIQVFGEGRVEELK